MAKVVKVAKVVKPNRNLTHKISNSLKYKLFFINVTNKENAQVVLHLQVVELLQITLLQGT